MWSARQAALVFVFLLSSVTVLAAVPLLPTKQLLAGSALGAGSNPRPLRTLLQKKTGLSNELRKVCTLIDWDEQTKLPPWLSPIDEGAEQGLAVVLGQSLKPDGSAAQVLIDRARMAKTLLDQKKVTKVLVSGGDPARVGRTEAAMMAGVLREEGIPAERIIQEPQAMTTAENAWFTLRWIPKGTGQLYIVTSEFHIPRATYIFQETFNYFYGMVEDAYKNNPEWKSTTKRYPRLAIHPVPTKSFCGSDEKLNTDNNPRGDINTKSLALRSMNELRGLGSYEVPNALFGPPLNEILYIWPIQINVTKDPENKANLQTAMTRAMNVVRSLCVCQSPPEKGGREVDYPMKLPIPTALPAGETTKDWRKVRNTCLVHAQAQRSQPDGKSGSSLRSMGTISISLLLIGLTGVVHS